jgi:hypothetical protein
VTFLLRAGGCPALSAGPDIPHTLRPSTPQRCLFTILRPSYSPSSAPLRTSHRSPRHLPGCAPRRSSPPRCYLSLRQPPHEISPTPSLPHSHHHRRLIARTGILLWTALQTSHGEIVSRALSSPRLADTCACGVPPSAILSTTRRSTCFFSATTMEKTSSLGLSHHHIHSVRPASPRLPPSCLDSTTRQH